MSAASSITVKPVTSAGSAAAPANPETRMSTALEAVEKIFADTAWGSKKKEMTEQLSSAYSALHEICTKEKGLSNTHESAAARIFYIYGRVLYGGGFKASLSMFQLSLNIQLVSCKVLGAQTLTSIAAKGHSLEALPGELIGAAVQDAQSYIDVPDFKELNAKLMETDVKTASAALGNDKAFQVAETLRWMGHSYQNINVFNSAEYSPRFEKIYGLAFGILMALNTKDSLWEAGQIVYNTSRFVHRLKADPKTMETTEGIQGMLKTMDPLQGILEAEGKSVRAQTLRAQIKNITMIELEKVKCTDAKEAIANKKAALVATQEALAIAESTEGFDPFLKTMFRNNVAQRAFELLQLDQPILTPQQIAPLFQKTLAEIESTGHDHSYHARYLLNAAKFECHQKNREGCNALIDKTIQVIKKFPESTKDVANMLKTFCEQFGISLQK